VTGHTHHGCHRTHREDIHEWTLPSFSWRNKDNPSFMLVSIASNYLNGYKLTLIVGVSSYLTGCKVKRILVFYCFKCDEEACLLHKLSVFYAFFAQAQALNM
jgi:hypothetical protein